MIRWGDRHPVRRKRRTSHAASAARARRGFSLVELLVVIAIVAITAKIALPRWAGSVQNYQLNIATQQIITDLTVAQARANYGSAAASVVFDPTANSYQIPGLADPDRAAGTYTVKLGEAPYRVTLVSANFGGAAQASFDAYGTPTAGGTVVLRGGTRLVTITVDATSGKAAAQ
ncbi:MAG: type II secretion system protein [Planctomycetota bacterium]|nr:type II secretion system protein [Planctomycetota bacterium]